MASEKKPSKTQTAKRLATLCMAFVWSARDKGCGNKVTWMLMKETVVEHEDYLGHWWTEDDWSWIQKKAARIVVDEFQRRHELDLIDLSDAYFTIRPRR